MLKQYIFLTKASLKKALEYRTNIVVGLLSRLLLFLVLSNMWKVIYTGDAERTSYMVTYSLVTVLFSSVIDLRLGRHIAQDIKSGSLNKYLLKPMSLVPYYFFSNLGTAIINLLVAIIIIAIFTNHPAVVFDADTINLPAFSVAGILGFILYCEFYIVAGLMAFWTTETKFFDVFVNKAIKFFGGGYIPITIFSPFLIKIVTLLPFASSIYLPVSLLLAADAYTNPSTEILKSAVWAIVLFIIIKILLKMGKLKYEAIGQ
jgi:ABC-2 type transport system permease protein